MIDLNLDEKTETIVTVLGFLGIGALLAWVVYSPAI